MDKVEEEGRSLQNPRNFVKACRESESCTRIGEHDKKLCGLQSSWCRLISHKNQEQNFLFPVNQTPVSPPSPYLAKAWCQTLIWSQDAVYITAITENDFSLQTDRRCHAPYTCRSLLFELHWICDNFVQFHGAVCWNVCNSQSTDWLWLAYFFLQSLNYMCLSSVKNLH